MRFVLVMLVTIALAACEAERGTAAPEDHPRVAVEGTLIAEGDEVQVCYRVLTSSPPKCGGGLEVVEAEDLPGAGAAASVASGKARLVGELHNGTLRLTEGPLPPEGSPGAPAEEQPPPRRPLAEPELFRLLDLHHEEVQPILDDADGAWLDAGVDQVRGGIRVTVVDDRGELAERLREEFEDDVVVRGWVTYLD